MTKYNISKEYGILRYFKPPFNKVTIFIARLIQSNKFLKRLNDKELQVKEEKITTSDNNKISLYILEPRKVPTDKVMIYYHGGAFVFKGSIRRHQLCREYVLKGNCKLVFIDYRLAPKYKYPIPVNDCYDAYKWVIKNSSKLKIDINKIIIAGDSAGGCLSADVTLKALEEKEIIPSHQMLIYPALDKRMLTNSMKKYRNTPLWNAKNHEKMWKYYLGQEAYLSPNEHTNFKNYPQTYIETAEFDCLHDEAVEYAEKLREAGINVILNETKMTMHGFEIKNTAITKKHLNKRIAFINSIATENIDLNKNT